MPRTPAPSSGEAGMGRETLPVVLTAAAMDRPWGPSSWTGIQRWERSRFQHPPAFHHIDEPWHLPSFGQASRTVFRQEFPCLLDPA